MSATKCRKTGDPAQSPEAGRKSKVLAKQSRSTRLRLPTAFWALCCLPCSRYGLQIVPGESSMECGGTRGCHTRSNGHSFAALCAEPHSRASLHFSSTTETTSDRRDAWRKSFARLAPPAYELCVQRLRWYQSIAREPARHAHFFCCWFGRMHFESHDTFIEGLRLHPEANGYSKRLLADLQTLAFVPEWAEQVANVELEFGDVFRVGSKLNEWCLSLDLRQFGAAFFTWKERMKSTFLHS